MINTKYVSNFIHKISTEDQSICFNALSLKVTADESEKQSSKEYISGFDKNKFFSSYKYIDPVQLVLVITEDCNLRCTYCFQDSSVTRTMTPEVLNDVLEYFFGKIFSISSNELIVRFYGGEPLLNFEIINKAVQIIRHKLENSLIRYRFVINTNATILDANICQFLKKNNFTVCVSLDGSDIVHNKNRGIDEKTFSSIVNSILDMMNHHINVQISVTLSSININSLIDISRWIVEYLGISSFGFNLLNQSSISEKLISLQFEKLLEVYDFWVSKGIVESNIGRIFLALMNEEPIQNHCLAYNGGQVVFDPTGLVFTCECVTDNETLGSKNFVQLKKQWHKLLPIYNINCESCIAIGVCGGGCAHQTIMENGSSLNNNINKYCQFYRMAVIEFLRRYK